MKRNQPKCEHCGHNFDPSNTVKGPVICPACGLTAHPFSPENDHKPTTSRQGIMISAVIVILLTTVLACQLIILKRTGRTRNEVEQLVLSLERLETNIDQINANPPPPVIDFDEALDDEAESDDGALRPSDDIPRLTREEQRLHDRLTAQLSKRHPPYRINDPVKLRLQNGQLHRGLLVGVKDGFVLVLQNGEIQDIKMSSLDRESRMRVDPVYREKAIQYQMDRRKFN